MVRKDARLTSLLRLDIPRRCRRFSLAVDRYRPLLPFVGGAIVLDAVRSLPADLRRFARGHFQELRRAHPGDAPRELAEVLKALREVLAATDRQRQDRAERAWRERRAAAAFARGRQECLPEERRLAMLEGLLAFDDAFDDDLVPGMVRVDFAELSASERAALA